MQQTIYYKPQIGKATKDVLREIAPADQNHVKKVFNCYLALAEVDPRPGFKVWFNEPNKQLPKLKDKGTGHNSPRTWCEGIIAKLNQAPNKRDLSPRACDGIQTLSRLISDLYDDCPYLVFENKLHQKQSAIPPSFDKIFKRKSS